MFYNFLFPQYFRGKGVSLLILVVRVVFGVLFFTHGLDKMINFNSLVDTYPSVLGFGSYTTLMVSVFCEFCCSLFLIAGLLDRNLDGETFETPLLYWDQKAESVYSDSSIVITRENSIIKGIGFRSNQSLTKYTILQPTGVFPLKE